MKKYRYRIKEVSYGEGEVYFFPQQTKGWFNAWSNVGYTKFLKLEEARRATEQAANRQETVERLRNPPTTYHSYKN